MISKKFMIKDSLGLQKNEVRFPSVSQPTRKSNQIPIDEIKKYRLFVDLFLDTQYIGFHAFHF